MADFPFNAPLPTTIAPSDQLSKVVDIGGQVFNVKAYGAKGDGVTDDTAAIQAAQAAAAASGGDLYLPPGNYKATSSQISGQTSGIQAVFFPDSNVRWIGSGVGSTKISCYAGAGATRVDGFAFGFDNVGATQNVSNFQICNLTIDGSNIGWSGIGYGSAIRWANPSATGTDGKFSDLVLSTWSSEWGISFGGFSTNFARLSVKHVRTAGTKYGGVWIGLTDYVRLDDLYSDTISGNSATGEGCVLEVESGNYGRFTAIKGSLVPISLVLLSGNLSASFAGIAGTCASGADGVRISGSASNIKISDIDLAGNGGGGTGFRLFGSGSPANIKVDGLSLRGFTNDISQDSGNSIADFSVNGIHLVDPTAINLVGATGLSIIGGEITGASNHWAVLGGCSGVIEGVTIVSSGAYFDAGGNSDLTIRSCPGYNPTGPQTAPAIPTSGTAYTNPFPFDCAVYITGGTVTAVAIGGTATGLTSGQFFVPAGETIALTYSAAPTWTWFGN